MTFPTYYPLVSSCQSGQRYPVHYENDGYQTTHCNDDDTPQYEKKTNHEQLFTPESIKKMASLASQMPQFKKMSHEKSFNTVSFPSEKEYEKNPQPFSNDFYAPDTIPVRETNPNILDLLQREDNLMKIQFEEERKSNSLRKSQNNQPYVSAVISREEIPTSCSSPSLSRNHMQPSFEMIERMYISPSSSFCNDLGNNVIVSPSSSNIQRWAGASYSNSPSPTQLPKPSFSFSSSQNGGGSSSFVQKLNFEEENNGELNSMSNQLKMMLQIA